MHEVFRKLYPTTVNNSTINTIAQAPSETIIRLFSKYAKTRATTNPAIADGTLSVAYIIAGKVITDKVT